MSTSPSSITRRGKNDVFLSFRTLDTGDNFTSHLSYALRRNGIKTFADDQLQKGHEILPGLLKAIEESKISIIIFSKNYASSEWCLDELVKITECKRKNGQIVIPVYYHVKMEDVRNQSGSFKNALVNQEKRFKRVPEKLQQWRDAMTEASNIMGWDSSITKPESDLVDEIVKDIRGKLNNLSPSSNFEDLVEVDSCLEQSKSSHNNNTGVGGTIVVEDHLFNQISCQFEASRLKVYSRHKYVKIATRNLSKGGSNRTNFHYCRRCNK